LNHAALAPPAVEIPFSSTSGMSYFSNFTPRAISSATSFFDVLDLPERLARLRGASVRRRIQKTRRAVGKLVSYAACCYLLRLKA
jgi:hypothetical protein